MNPTPTTCIAMSFPIPKSEHAIGINNNEPPATPEAPHAPNVAITHKISADGMSTEMPSVFAAAKVIIAIVMAAPSMLIVAPKGIEIQYISLSRPSYLQSSIFTGIFAAELLVKKAVIPLSLRHLKTNGYGFFFSIKKTIKGFTTKAKNNIQPTKTSKSFP